MPSRGTARQTELVYRELFDILLTNHTRTSDESARFLRLYFPTYNLRTLDSFGSWLARKTSDIARIAKMLLAARALLTRYRALFAADPTRTPRVHDTDAVLDAVNLPRTTLDDPSLNGLVYMMNHVIYEIYTDNLAAQSHLFVYAKALAHAIQLDAQLIVMAIAQRKRKARR